MAKVLKNMPFQKQLKESGVLRLEKGILVVVVIIEGGVNRCRETTFIVYQKLQASVTSGRLDMQPQRPEYNC